MSENYPSRLQSEQIFEDVIKIRNSSTHPFKPEWEKEFRNHCSAVANIAQKIAEKTAYLNSEKAYSMGLLHDCGRLKDEFAEQRFHGVVGYEWLLQKGYPELAKISITHSFYEKSFNINNFTQPREDLLFCQRYLRQIEYDDYDLLLQLCDILNDCGQTCTIEYRFNSLAQRYKNQNYYNNIPTLNKIKQYFDNLCQIDLYELIGIDKNEEQFPATRVG